MDEATRKGLEAAAVDAIRKAALDLDTDLLPAEIVIPIGAADADGRAYKFELVVRMEVDGE